MFREGLLPRKKLFVVISRLIHSSTMWEGAMSAMLPDLFTVYGEDRDEDERRS